MLYQKLLIGDTPYQLTTGTMTTPFEIHRHPEIELIYCFDGSFKIRIDNTDYVVNSGSMALVSPMVAHEILKSDSKGNRTLLIVVGASFLHESFEYFSAMTFTSPVAELNSELHSHQKLKELLEETANIYDSKTNFGEMQIIGNIHKICGYILQEFAKPNPEITKNLKIVENIEKALELIRTHYAEPISVDMVSEITGYGKSNFCKIFKAVTGDTFHNVLNRQRVKNACIYIDETSMTVTDIASIVGFSDTKSFCRVFKSIMGMTAGEYRKSK